MVIVPRRRMDAATVAEIAWPYLPNATEVQFKQIDGTVRNNLESVDQGGGCEHFLLKPIQDVRAFASPASALLRLASVRQPRVPEVDWFP